MGKLLTLAASVAAAYAVTGLYFVFSIDRIMYYPRRGLDARPEDFSLQAEEVAFTASDGTPLHGWYFPRPGSNAVLVFLHGNAGNISHRLATVHQLLRAPADVFLFDYRGYGLSGGKAKGEAPLLDAEAALEEVRSRTDGSGKKIVLLGESVGGSMGLVLAARERVDGVVTLGAFTSTRAVARGIPLFMPFSPIVPNRFDALGALPSVKVPLLLIHGTEDEVIPFSHGERLYAAASEPKEHFWVQGGMHNDLFAVAGIEIVDRIAGFIEKLDSSGAGVP